MDYWFEEMKTRVRYLPQTKRYLTDLIDWSEHTIGIVGARGTGKTTLMLQYASLSPLTAGKVLYISLDHPRFKGQTLFEFGLQFHRYGGKLLLLDEVHKFENWSGHVKTLIDSCPEMQIIFSGSSLLKMQLQDADLSRRAVVYHLPGLSFREFLLLEQNFKTSPVSLETLVTHHSEYADDFCRKLRPLEHFRNYLNYGYYPYFLENRDTYPLKLGEVLNQVLEIDLPVVARIDLRQIGKIKKLLYFLATTVPAEINIQKLSSLTEISRPKIYEYLEYMQKARLLNLVRSEGKSYRVMSKPEKLYLENTNLSQLLTDDVNRGTIRETFFVNQIRNAAAVSPSIIDESLYLADSGDFFVGNTYTFEVGGRGKGRKQLNDSENGYIVSDDTEIGFGNRIPLWLFGFLY